ncbi:hypothetical protein BGX23_010457 [Mortierella sp. AD031]|nr:hypothetical protein BGX23_010457 [Mortierella sp. AD031]
MSDATKALEAAVAKDLAQQEKIRAAARALSTKQSQQPPQPPFSQFTMIDSPNTTTVALYY